MLEMPQMIQTWKEVCFPMATHVQDRLLILDCREVMVVDGRSGQNRYDNEVYLAQYQPCSEATRCTNTIFGVAAWEMAFHNIVGWCKDAPSILRAEKYLRYTLGRISKTTCHSITCQSSKTRDALL